MRRRAGIYFRVCGNIHTRYAWHMLSTVSYDGYFTCLRCWRLAELDFFELGVLGSTSSSVHRTILRARESSVAIETGKHCTVEEIPSISSTIATFLILSFSVCGQGRQNDAASAIKWFWGRHCNANAAIQAIQSDLDSSDSAGSLRDLFAVRANRRGFFMCVLLMFFQQFSGINAVIFFSMAIFESAGSDIKPAICALIIGVVQVLATVLAAALVERAGRKILLVQSSAIMCLCLTALGVFFYLKKTGHDVSAIGIVPLASLVLFIIAFSTGYGPIPWMMMGELLPSDVKSIATSITVLYNWTSVTIITLSFESLKESLGDDVTFWIFAVIMGLGTVYGMKFLFETKGKSNAEIMIILGGGK